MGVLSAGVLSAGDFAREVLSVGFLSAEVLFAGDFVRGGFVRWGFCSDPVGSRAGLIIAYKHYSIISYIALRSVELSLECSHKDKQVQYGRCGDLFGV